jgi:phosphoribosylaminoimidazole (AIR) synthetase
LRALIGGETAEMPGCTEGDFDLQALVLVRWNVWNRSQAYKKGMFWCDVQWRIR